jgi:hypothetical protein
MQIQRGTGTDWHERLAKSTWISVLKYDWTRDKKYEDRRGVKLVSYLSPILLILYSKYLTKEASKCLETSKYEDN